MTPRARRRLLVVTLLLASLTAWESAMGPGSSYWHSQPVNSDPPASPPEARPAGGLRVLFIGNSFTRYWGGQALIQTRLAESWPGWRDRRPALEQVTANGFSLKDHWSVSRALKRVREGNWDDVVLQDHSEGPLNHREEFFDTARRFDAEIKKVGAHTILFMTWAKANEPQNQPALAEAYETLGREIGADVVPVGLAFAESLAHRPDLRLHDPDGKHPSAAGSYLSGCCFHCFFYNRNPDGLTNLIEDRGKDWININATDARYLQGVAYKVVTQHPRSGRSAAPPTR